MNERASWVSYAVAALAVLATAAFVPTDAAGLNGPPDRVRCCIPEDGQLECGQLTEDHCARVGGTSIGAGSCAHNPCASSTTTTTPASATTKQAATPTTQAATTTTQAATTTTQAASKTTQAAHTPTQAT